MKKLLGILFIACGVMFTMVALLFFLTIIASFIWADIFTVSNRYSGFIGCILISSVCMGFAYAFIFMGKQIRRNDDDQRT